MNLIFSLFSTNGVVLYSIWWNLALHFLPNYLTPILYHRNIIANVICQFTSWGRVTNSHAGHWNWKNMGLGKIKMNERLSLVMLVSLVEKNTSASQSKDALNSTICQKSLQLRTTTIITFISAFESWTQETWSDMKISHAAWSIAFTLGSCTEVSVFNI